MVIKKRLVYEGITRETNEMLCNHLDRTGAIGYGGYTISSGNILWPGHMQCSIKDKWLMEFSYVPKGEDTWRATIDLQAIDEKSMKEAERIVNRYNR